MKKKKKKRPRKLRGTTLKEGKNQNSGTNGFSHWKLRPKIRDWGLIFVLGKKRLKRKGRRTVVPWEKTLWVWGMSEGVG